jgi:hypothetical protein
VNKGMKKGRSCYAPAHGLMDSLLCYAVRPLFTNVLGAASTSSSARIAAPIMVHAGPRMGS